MGQWGGCEWNRGECEWDSREGVSGTVGRGVRQLGECEWDNGESVNGKLGDIFNTHTHTSDAYWCVTCSLSIPYQFLLLLWTSLESTPAPPPSTYHGSRLPLLMVY